MTPECLGLGYENRAAIDIGSLQYFFFFFFIKKKFFLTFVYF